MPNVSAPGPGPAAIQTTVAGLGYDLVDVERAAGGVLRVTIDHPAGAADTPERFITVDDCERVTRQLQHVLEVEGTTYQRLEVSSPGLDRPLRTERDFERFAGAAVELTLKEPFQGRKRWKGELARGDGGWRLLLAEASLPSVKTLDFALAEVRDARLVPVLDFKGRRAGRPAPAGQEGRVGS